MATYCKNYIKSQQAERYMLGLYDLENDAVPEYSVNDLEAPRSDGMYGDEQDIASLG